MLATEVRAAPPVQYVKVCDQYGAGFFYMPGTDMCLKPQGHSLYDVRHVPFGSVLPAPDRREAACQSLLPGSNWYPGTKQCFTYDLRGDTAYGTLRSFSRLDLPPSQLAPYTSPTWSPSPFGNVQIGIGGTIAGAWGTTDYNGTQFSSSGWGGGPSIVVRDYLGPNFFIGFDAQWLATNISGTTDNGDFARYNWQGTLAGQVGYTAPLAGLPNPVTVYGEFGVAAGGLTFGATFGGQNTPAVQETMTRTGTGWTIGAGIEEPIRLDSGHQFNIGFEYRYIRVTADLLTDHVSWSNNSLALTARFMTNPGNPYSSPLSVPRTYDRWWLDGPYVGIEGVQTASRQGLREFSLLQDKVTFRSCDDYDPFGIGVVAGYAFSPWSNIRVSPYVSVDAPNETLNHTFANGNSIGTRSNVTATLGVKAGPVVALSPSLPSFWIYGLAGVSVLNEDLNISFAPVLSSSNVNVAGATVGGGFSFQPSFLQGWGHPVALFADYQLTRWDSGQLNSPTASPFFNYTFRREDLATKFGFTVALDSPAAPANIPVKAPRVLK
jgi:hypothetical protein